jgi:hypothetical protein
MEKLKIGDVCKIVRILNSSRLWETDLIGIKCQLIWLGSTNKSGFITCKVVLLEDAKKLYSKGHELFFHHVKLKKIPE